MQNCTIQGYNAHCSPKKPVIFHVFVQMSTSVQRTTEAVTWTQLVQTMTEVSPVLVTQDTPEMESSAVVSENSFTGRNQRYLQRSCTLICLLK